MELRCWKIAQDQAPGSETWTPWTQPPPPGPPTMADDLRTGLSVWAIVAIVCNSAVGILILILFAILYKACQVPSKPPNGTPALFTVLEPETREEKYRLVAPWDSLMLFTLTEGVWVGVWGALEEFDTDLESCIVAKYETIFFSLPFSPSWAEGGKHTCLLSCSFIQESFSPSSVSLTFTPSRLAELRPIKAERRVCLWRIM